MSFETFGLCPEILRAVNAKNYKTPTPIQEKTIPHVLEGKDLLGCAQTGTGKTAAFALPILQRLFATHDKGRRRRAIRVLVLTPTRELANQIADSFGAYGRGCGTPWSTVASARNPRSRLSGRGSTSLWQPRDGCSTCARRGL